MYVGLLIPTANMKVKVLEREGVGFVAVTNIHVVNRFSRNPEPATGTGSTVEEALNDVLVQFKRTVIEQTPDSGLAESDIVWSNPNDF